MTWPPFGHVIWNQFEWSGQFRFPNWTLLLYYTTERTMKSHAKPIAAQGLSTRFNWALAHLFGVAEKVWKRLRSVCKVKQDETEVTRVNICIRHAPILVLLKWMGACTIFVRYIASKQMRLKGRTFQNMRKLPKEESWRPWRERWTLNYLSRNN